MDALVKQVTRHFECLGYEVTPQPDGWVFAEHPVRLNVLFKPIELGVRLHCSVALGKATPDVEAWHPFLNRANDISAFSRFSIAKSDGGEWFVRVRALLPARYDRRTFGLLLDAWQEDVALLRNAPRATDDAEEEADDEQKPEVPVVVN